MDRVVGYDYPIDNNEEMKMENNYEMKTDRKLFKDMEGDDCWIDTMTNFGDVTVEIVIDDDSGSFPVQDADTVRAMGEHLIKMADYMESQGKLAVN